MIKNIKTIVVLVFTILLTSCATKEAPKEVLFVCTYGAARSPLAAAYFNKIAKENNLNYTAIHRGLTPKEVLDKEANDGLQKDDFDTNGWKPSKVSATDIANANMVVTFDCKLPEAIAADKITRWNGTPSTSVDYDIARDAIKAKVEALVASLSEQ